MRSLRTAEYGLTTISPSTILGTTKTHEAGGVRVFTSDGTEVEFHPVGHANSVDVVYEFPITIKGKTEYVDLAVVGSRETNEVVIFRIHPDTGRLSGIVKKEGTNELESARIPAGAKIYGSCDYRFVSRYENLLAHLATSHRSNIDGRYYVFVTTKRGELLQHEIFWQENSAQDGGDIKSELRRKFIIGGQSRDKDMRPPSIVEGCVADHELGFVYFSEEAVGIWKFKAEPDESADYPVLVDSTDPGKDEGDRVLIFTASGCSPRRTSLCRPGRSDNFRYRRRQWLPYRLHSR